MKFPKPTKPKKPVTIEYMDGLWRKAVRLHWGYDPFEKERSGLICQCHHIIKRDNLILRWELMNGILLTVKNHSLVNTEKMKEMIFSHPHIDREFLEKMKQKDFKQYLLENCLTMGDFMMRQKERLQGKIKSMEGRNGR